MFSSVQASSLFACYRNREIKKKLPRKTHDQLREQEILRLKQEVITLEKQNKEKRYEGEEVRENTKKMLCALEEAAELGCYNSIRFLCNLYMKARLTQYTMAYHALVDVRLKPLCDITREDSEKYLYYCTLGIQFGDSNAALRLGMDYLQSPEKSYFVQNQIEGIACFKAAALLGDSEGVYSLKAIFEGRFYMAHLEWLLFTTTPGSIESIQALIEVARLSDNAEIIDEAITALKQLNQTQINPEANKMMNAFLNSLQVKDLPAGSGRAPSL